MTTFGEHVKEAWKNIYTTQNKEENSQRG